MVETARAGQLSILCITGWCRNGSTIIGNILNEVPGLFHVGELHFLWKNAAGKGSNTWCGCRRMLTDCPIWSKILPVARPSGASVEAFAGQVIRRQQRYVRTRHTWRVLARGIRDDGIKQHADLMTRTYHAIAQLTGARVIVDTTKIPGEAALLPLLDGIRPYFVHLVRDPRATAESWRLPKEYAYTLSSTKSTAYWLGFNLATEAITRKYPQQSMFLRYEDFIADPENTIGDLLRFAGADPAANPLRGRTIELHTNHTVTGNPDRFRTGITTIRDGDDSWMAGLPRRARLAALAISWPRFHRYGYPARSRERATATKREVTLPQGTDRP